MLKYYITFLFIASLVTFAQDSEKNILIDPNSTYQCSNYKITDSCIVPELPRLFPNLTTVCRRDEHYDIRIFNGDSTFVGTIQRKYDYLLRNNAGFHVFHSLNMRSLEFLLENGEHKDSIVRSLNEANKNVFIYYDSASSLVRTYVDTLKAGLTQGNVFFVKSDSLVKFPFIDCLEQAKATNIHKGSRSSSKDFPFQGLFRQVDALGREAKKNKEDKYLKFPVAKE